MSGRRSQSGVALIMVLLAFALGSIFATGMMSRQNLMIHRMGNYMTQSEAQSLALGAEAFGRQILQRDWEQDSQQENFIDHPGEDWAQYAVALPVDAGAIEAQINDLQGRLNLNALVREDGQPNELMQERFERLFAALDIRTVSVEALIDWIDENDQPTGAAGAEDGEYLRYNPAYRAANQPFVHTSELRLMDGISEEDYRMLRPHVAALPDRTPELNVNFATPAVIRSLHERIGEAEAEAVFTATREEPFTEMQDFLARPEFSGLGLEDEGLGLRSYFFEVATRVTVSNNVQYLVSKVHRGEDGEIQVLSRDGSQTGIITKETIQAPE